ncbi:DNA-binding response OmpR family regulator [Methylobacterium sp. BE186]|uniref:response regulator n=1 Tax=Methylobacterium sp. BE186 TaxID=2817715 RepID=UPI0028625E53|nr:response regulator [Methylobacterium sp. BE186]MDR7039454.1 DNA-binding response OmpR family regulator [Methylobacterium sp. BE186]
MAASSGSPVLKDCRILVVEDRYILANDIAQALGAEGAEVVGPVPNLAHGLALSRSRPLDAAILDIDLRGEEDIFGLAEELMRKAVPIVFATGVDRAIVPSAFEGVPRLDKPVELAELVSTVAALVANARTDAS